MKPLFLLADCNNFYVSCERVFQPKLIGKAVVILSNNDGCVVARSNEAKKLGIPMGAPYFQFEPLLKAHRVAVLSSNYALYDDFSRRVMSILKQECEKIEVYSIDEAFLQVTLNDPEDFAKSLREKILKWTSIPVSIGIADTKTLAKIANHQAKKLKSGIFFLKEHQVDPLLDTLAVTEIWGIGKKWGERLAKLSVFTAKQLKELDPHITQKQLTIVGLRIALELGGTSCLSIEEVPSAKKSICRSKAFGRPVSQLHEMQEAISHYASKAAQALREEHSVASLITVWVEEHPFKAKSYHRTATFAEPTNNTPQIITQAKALVASLFKEGATYRKTGIILDGIIPDTSVQRDLFIPYQVTEKQRQVMQALDLVNMKFGKETLFSAAVGMNKEWQMKRCYKTAHYTTSWNDLLTVKI